MKRHKDKIKNRLCQNITKKRAAVDSEVITIISKSLAGVFPENIINYDETNLSDDPGRRRLIFKRGARCPERIINGTKASTSLMLAGTAAGHVLPVYVVYKSDNLWSTWTEGGPPRARYNRTKTGWFENVTFVDWFKTIAPPYCTRLEAGSKKVLIGDNLSSHFSNEVLDLCEKNNINFICMPPNTTHLCQPLDVAYFAPMKRQWRKILTNFKQSNRKNAGTVPKDQFPRLLKLLMKMPNQNENLIAGFRKCGIFPLDKTQGRLPSNPAQSAQLNSSVSEAFTQHLVDLRTGTGDASAPKRRRRTKMDVVPERSVSRLEDIVEPQEERATTSSTAATNTDADLALQHEEVPESEFLSDIEDEHVRNLLDIFNN